MKCLTRKLRPPLKTHGGKSYLAKRIVALFPEHDTYVEPFAGGLSVLLNKPRSRVESVTDLNRDLISFYFALRDDPKELIRLVAATRYDAETFDCALEYAEEQGPAMDALIFLVRNRFSRGGLGKVFAWSDRLRGGQPGDVNAWKTIAAELPVIAERLANVGLQTEDFAWSIRMHESPTTLIYADPPYLHETRTATKAYTHEMGRADHERLLGMLIKTPSKVFLSGYRNDLYDSFLPEWTRHEFSMPNHSGQGKTKQRRIECLWESP
jgi:DNA adenine methylase